MRNSELLAETINEEILKECFVNLNDEQKQAVMEYALSLKCTTC